ncbi:hypothetical protein Cni_G20585 [Canna indica]|uniref:Uncharacterized protein n=1 Tax=Canna indica TaxID=4628 RepID=A0AAQ3QJU7_9LILI|nr:hypothetical protein Cni_G20585 [Canna indica]
MASSVANIDGKSGQKGVSSPIYPSRAKKPRDKNVRIPDDARPSRIGFLRDPAIEKGEPSSLASEDWIPQSSCEPIISISSSDRSAGFWQVWKNMNGICFNNKGMGINSLLLKALAEVLVDRKAEICKAKDTLLDSSFLISDQMQKGQTVCSKFTLMLPGFRMRCLLGLVPLMLIRKTN